MALKRKDREKIRTCRGKKRGGGVQTPRGHLKRKGRTVKAKGRRIKEDVRGQKIKKGPIVVKLNAKS